MSTNAHWDAVVVGCGGVGSAVLRHAAQRGAKVLGLDRFEPGHDRGSSHGQTRVIRQAYFEHPDYVPLLLRAYELWEELARDSGQSLYEEVGVLQAGPASGEVIAGVLASARQHHLDVETLTPGELAKRWPGFRVPDEDCAAVFERRAGFLHVERCVRAHYERALADGAEARIGVEFLGWRPEGSGLAVMTDQGTILTDRLILTAGAWAPRLLQDLGVSVVPIRKPSFWFEPDDSALYSARQGCPAFLIEQRDSSIFYALPSINECGVKTAEHTGRVPVADPLQLDRSMRPEDRERVETFISAYMPKLSRRLTRHSVCMYAMSPDSHFLVDRHPDDPRVMFAAGLSGHGFKFASVLGEILTNWALDGRTPHPVDFLGLKRFG